MRRGQWSGAREWFLDPILAALGNAALPQKVGYSITSGPGKTLAPTFLQGEPGVDQDVDLGEPCCVTHWTLAREINELVL